MSHALEAQAHVFDFVVEENKEIAEDIFALTIRSKVAKELKPGQFMNLAIPGDPSQILRIPLSFNCADAKNGLVFLEYAVVGDGTRRLSLMKPQDASTLVGPCGNGWALPSEPGRCLVVAGGIGAPPVVAAARMLADAGIGFDAVVGSHTAAKVLDADLEILRTLGAQSYSDCERTVILTSDDGTAGRPGFVTGPVEELLAARSYSSVYTCGPLVMMALVARLAAASNVKCQASLERMMGCGFGACSCCNVELVNGSQALCCMDGPVFDAKEVAW